mmetsp:Transcript_4913/g.6517  ORF Transcript_4913/g.6517 Transcript_4913/m.6517 type:complete len:95 (-) Transcript_4913:695-979(-)
MPNRELPYENNWHNALTLEMSLTRKDYYRRVYSGLDLAADLGGLFSAISPFFKIALDILNLYSSYQFVMGDVFVDSSSKKAISDEAIAPATNNV